MFLFKLANYFVSSYIFDKEISTKIRLNVSMLPCLLLRLTDWMSGAESCLQSVEPREEDILRLEVELQEFRPVLDNINLIGPQLCQVSQHHR